MSLDVAALRAETPACAEVVHLNNAGASLMSAAVVDAVVGHIRLEARIGGYEAAAAVQETIERTYDSVANLLGARRHEIALLDNATRAWCTAFYAMRFGPGDRILTARAEYGSNVVAMLQVAERSGAIIDVAPDDETGQVSVAALEQMISDRTRLIALTHAPAHCGLVNPAAEVGALARAAGVPFLLDAAQSLGQLSIDVAQIGCDFLTATGRKFLRGPRGTGLLYVKEDLIAQLDPPMLDLRAASWVGTQKIEVRDDARRFETWETAVAVRLGLGVAVDQALALGSGAIEQRITYLAERLRSMLREVPHIEVHDKGVRSGGIVTFTDDRRPAAQVADHLRARAINVSVTNAEQARFDIDDRGLPPTVRASVHCYNTEEELDLLVEALS